MRLASGQLPLLLVTLLGLVAAACGSASFAIQPETLPQATVGTPYAVEIDAVSTTTGQPDTGAGLDTSGSLPPGLTFSSDQHGRATLSGTPTTAGSYPFVVQAAGYCTNSTCARADRTYTLVVNP